MKNKVSDDFGDFNDFDCPICEVANKADAEGRPLTIQELKRAFSRTKSMGFHVGSGEDLMQEENAN